MKTEYEATFLDIDKDEMRARLKAAGAELVRAEYMQKRVNFDLQPLGRTFYDWVRVRDEGDKVTMAFKSIPPDAAIDEQKEVEFTISDMEAAIEFMTALGARVTNRSESTRERWTLDGAEVDLDTWPFLEPYIEIESDAEDKVRAVAAKLGFDWADALFCGAGKIYKMKYGVHPDTLAEKEPVLLTFGGPNPFLKL